MIACWNVAFEPGRTWLGHVQAFGFDGAAGVWVVVDPCLGVTDVTVLRRRAFDRWVADLAGRAEIYRIDRRTEAWPFQVRGLWCVGQVKRLVGLRSGALSPAGLKRDLLKAGALRVFHRNEAAQSHRRGPAGQARA
jgi:hypothetical protein